VTGSIERWLRLFSFKGIYMMAYLLMIVCCTRAVLVPTVVPFVTIVIKERTLCP
jgi:hypothetical protein